MEREAGGPVQLRFRPPWWVGVIWGLQSALQLVELLTGPGRAFHGAAFVLFTAGVVWYFTGAATVLDEHGIVTHGRWHRVRFRWADVSELGVLRRGDRNLTAILQDGRKIRLQNVRADAYPRVRDLMLGQERASARS